MRRVKFLKKKKSAESYPSGILENPSFEEAHSFLDNIEQIGSQDRHNNVIPEGIKGRICSAVSIVFEDLRTEATTRYKGLKESIKRLELKVKGLRSKRKKMHCQVQEKRSRARLWTGIIYVIGGAWMILGDWEFSRQTIVVAWGLGQDSMWSKASLIGAIASGALFFKWVYDKMVVPRFVEESKTQDVIVRVFVLVTTLLFLFLAGMLGYVRSVVYQISMLNQPEDVYASLFAAHPVMNTVSFILIAVAFMVGGAVLLSQGMADVSKYYVYKKDKKDLRRLGEALSEAEKQMELQLSQLESERVLWEFYNDGIRCQDVMKKCADVHEGRYWRGYLVDIRDKDDQDQTKSFKSTLKNSEHNPESVLDWLLDGIAEGSENGFHILLRKYLDLKAMDGSFNLEDFRDD